MTKKLIGVILIIVGLLALFTPFTPGSWLIFVGLELMGARILFWDKIKTWLFAKNKGASKIRPSSPPKSSGRQGYDSQ